MEFLTIGDYDSTIRRDILNMITDNVDNIRTSAERTAQQTIESYLKGRYDMTALFAQEGDARNPLILTYMMDIALYHILSRISPNNIPELRNNRYLDAMEFLKAVQKGNLSPNLPEIAENETKGFLRLGGADKVNSYW